MPRLLLPCFAALLLALPARGQQPFETLTLSAGGATSLAHGLFHAYWKPGYGGELTLGTPFYFGVAEGGVALHRYEILRPDVPRFDALLAYVGWSVAVRPARRLTWLTGVRVGNYRMSFDDDTFAGIRNESELTLGLHSRLQARVTEHWSIYGGASLLQTYTYIRLRNVYLSAGLSRRMTTPGWLRTFLQ